MAGGNYRPVGGGEGRAAAGEDGREGRSRAISLVQWVCIGMLALVGADVTEPNPGPGTQAVRSQPPREVGR